MQQIFALTLHQDDPFELVQVNLAVPLHMHHLQEIQYVLQSQHAFEVELECFFDLQRLE